MCVWMCGCHLPNNNYFFFKIQASEARAKYPSAVRLQESVKVYSRTCSNLNDCGALAVLAAGYKKRVQDCILKRINYRWHFNDRRMNEFVSEISTATGDFEEKVKKSIRVAVCV